MRGNVRGGEVSDVAVAEDTMTPTPQGGGGRHGGGRRGGGTDGDRKAA